MVDVGESDGRAQVSALPQSVIGEEPHGDRPILGVFEPCDLRVFARGVGIDVRATKIQSHARLEVSLSSEGSAPESGSSREHRERARFMRIAPEPRIRIGQPELCRDAPFLLERRSGEGRPCASFRLEPRRGEPADILGIGVEPKILVVARNRLAHVVSEWIPGGVAECESAPQLEISGRTF